jgi:plastocyanin
MSGRRRLLMLWLALTGLIIPGVGAIPAGVAGASRAQRAAGPNGLDAADGAVISATPWAPALPAEPGAALARAVEVLGADLGVRLDAAGAIARAGLPDGIAGRLAVLTSQLHSCYRAAAPARLALSTFGVPSDSVPARAGAGAALRAAAGPIRACAARLESLALESDVFLRHRLPQPAAASGGGLDVWPVLRYSPGNTSDRYVDDYALLVDEAGDDTYLNNAGGNLLDVFRGPEGTAAGEHGPARGCHKLALEVGTQCVAAAALLIDAAGNDTYQSREPPDPTDDGFCTADPLVRRIMTAGGSLAGVSVLIEGGGDDHYSAKTASQGSGHVAGVGVLRDLGGNDAYLALRNAQGYALAGGLGVLRDEGGDDSFDYYELAPLDPRASFQRPGSGGVVDDRGLCDRIPRQVQGTALLPDSVGVFLNLGGNDRYRGAPPATQDPGPPFSDTPLQHGSQGYGGAKAFGLFIDEGGHDSYTGVPGRADDTTVEPSQDSSGRFEDRASSSGPAARADYPDSLRPQAAPVGAGVTLKNNNFIPKNLVVRAGTEVTWTNDDGVGHTVTADDQSFDSHPACGSNSDACLRKGEHFSYTFAKAGRFPYYCRVHGASGGAAMAGTIEVQS